MIILVKIFHFIALAMGIGGGITNMVLGLRAASAEAPAKIALNMAQGAVGKVATAGLVLLWLTGIYLWIALHGAALSTQLSFQIKLAGVISLTLISAYANIMAMNAAKAGKGPDPVKMKRAGMGMMLSALVALIAAVVTFT